MISKKDSREWSPFKRIPNTSFVMIRKPIRGRRSPPTIAPQYSGKLPMYPNGVSVIGVSVISVSVIGVSVIGVSGIQSFDQPAEEIFDAFLEKELIGQWRFGPLLRKEEVLRITLDGRGGVLFFGPPP